MEQQLEGLLAYAKVMSDTPPAAMQNMNPMTRLLMNGRYFYKSPFLAYSLTGCFSP